jgi:flagella basal body P-ring formation protein FlgA
MNRDLRIYALIVVVSFGAFSANAAELRLKRQCAPQSPIVVLGEVADVFSADGERAEALKRIELFPAPAADQPRVLRVRELQDLLAARGINLSEHRFSGFAQVQIAAAKKRADANLPLSEQGAKRAQRRVEEAIQRYLREQSGAERPFQVQLELTGSQQRTFGTSSAPISVRGGAAPWIGKQLLTLAIDSPSGQEYYSLEVGVSEPSSVVAALHSLQRGSIIRAADLTLVPVDSRDDNETAVFHSIEEVAGKQVAKAVAEGKILTPDVVQSPLMVRKGDIVTIYSRAAGIRIHTTARAKDDGALNDLVTVESLADRKSFPARVCGPRETEVFAQAVKAE